MCPKGRGLMSVLFSVVSSGLEQDTVGRYSTNIEWMNGGFREQNSHLKKSKFGDSLENVENSTALGPLSHTDRSVELRTGCPASTEHGFLTGHLLHYSRHLFWRMSAIKTTVLALCSRLEKSFCSLVSVWKAQLPILACIIHFRNTKTSAAP